MRRRAIIITEYILFFHMHVGLRFYFKYYDAAMSSRNPSFLSNFIKLILVQYKRNEDEYKGLLHTAWLFYLGVRNIIPNLQSRLEVSYYEILS